jgi:hypothetical protein
MSTKTQKQKVYESDTKVRIMSNYNGTIDWQLTNGRHLIFLKAGTPRTIDFMELENMIWSSTLIQEGIIYVADKDAFEATGIQNVKWEDIKPLPQLKKMLSELEAEDLKEEISKLPEGNKELLAELAMQDFDNLRGSIVNTIEKESKINISQMKEDEKANKENQEKSKSK